jgi:2-phospho-L-lactate guanylyltransferase
MSDAPRTLVDPVRWSVVVPVKLLSVAKTRLGPLDEADRAELALAMAMDTVSAALACRAVARVIVVTDDERARDAAKQLDAVVFPDVPDAGLNDALAYAAGEAQRQWADSGVVALAADLPATKPSELDGVLTAAAAQPRSVVTDAAGDGTVALAVLPGSALEPAYGPGSFERHVASGAQPLTVPAPGLRRDVDTVTDLVVALGLGCGQRTAAVAAALGIGEQHGTVRRHDPRTRQGSVFLDDGVVVEYDAAAFNRGGLRLLRLGQRVRMATIGHGPTTRVDAVTVATLPFPD